MCKRNNRGFEPVDFNKITARLRNICTGLDHAVDYTVIARDTVARLHDGISTTEIDFISANIAESRKCDHPHYSRLAARLCVSSLHKNTPGSFAQCMRDIQESVEAVEETPLAVVPALAGYGAKTLLPFDAGVMRFISQYADELDAMIDHRADYKYSYFGIKTLLANYLCRVRGEVHDRPQYMLMRIAIALYGAVQREDLELTIGRDTYARLVGAGNTNSVSAAGDTLGVTASAAAGVTASAAAAAGNTDSVSASAAAGATAATADSVSTYADSAEPPAAASLDAIRACYNQLSGLYATHATPTLFNACARVQQLISCFLLGKHDGIERIMEAHGDMSVISKFAGGIGVHMHQIRCNRSRIYGTGGLSNGIPKQLKMLNALANTWNQGGRRNGSIAVYLEPVHGDIMQFLDMKNPLGRDDECARDLFYACWVPDLFMRLGFSDRDEPLSLFSGNEAKNLSVVYDGMSPDAVRAAGLAGVVDVTDPHNLDRAGRVRTFTALYDLYTAQGRAVSRVPIRSVIDKIAEMQRLTGTPYVCHKDHVNRKSNQANVGTICSSNLCAEINLYSDADSYACCNLASINLPKFVNREALREYGDGGLRTYRVDPLTAVDYELLHRHVRAVVRNLNRVIDVTTYPVDKCMLNNRQLRPIGVGVQGLADLFCRLRIPFASDTARRIDLAIAETIYHAFVEESCALARTGVPAESAVDVGVSATSADIESTAHAGAADAPADTVAGVPADEPTGVSAGAVDAVGASADTGVAVHASAGAVDAAVAPADALAAACAVGPYERFDGSPASRSVFQFELWRDNEQELWPCDYTALFSGLYDWEATRGRMVRGMANSCGVAYMPTVSTSQILGNNESFEPYHSNIYAKTTLAGKFIVTNDSIVEHLMELGLWNEQMRNRILADDGSVQNIAEIPPQVREIYRTVWEISQLELIKRTAARGAFVDQAQSFNVHLVDNSNSVLRGVMRAGWQYGLKTGSYYIRTRAASQTQKTIRAATGDSVRAVAGPSAQAPASTVVAGDVCVPGCTSCSG